MFSILCRTVVLPASFLIKDSLRQRSQNPREKKNTVIVSACRTTLMLPLLPMPLPPLPPVPCQDMLRTYHGSSMVAQLDTVHLQLRPQAWAPI